MRVHLIKKSTVEEFVSENERSKPSFQIWLTVIKYADWNKPEDIQNTFGSADLLGNGTYRIVFNIGGNNYRMICHYVFGENLVRLFICWIGTHAQYSKLCKEGKQYNINLY
jgi:mRNA interferase HigB